MKTISLLLLVALITGCDTAPSDNLTGRYVRNGNVVVETIDLAKGGAAMHTLDVPRENNPEVVAIFKKAELKQAKWSQDGEKIKLVGAVSVKDYENREVVWILELQPNGDLIRHDEEGEFVRFQKR
jgi:type III secretory pathway lipoprotein EscJ